MHRGIITKQVRVVSSNFWDHLIILTTELLDPGGSRVEEDTVVVKNVTVSTAFCTIRTLAKWSTIAITNEHRLFRSVSLTALVYKDREQALYCGMGIKISSGQA